MTFYKAQGLILSEKYLPDFTYVNLGEALAQAIKDEDLSGRFLPMKASSKTTSSRKSSMTTSVT